MWRDEAIKGHVNIQGFKDVPKTMEKLLKDSE